MSWFFGSSSSQKSNIPPTTALQQQRLKQIESLRTFHNITEVQRDVEYRVTFNVGTSTVFLNITLPPQFPNDKPIVKVAPPVRHPWVNDQMVIVGCPSLLNFYMHSNLGKAIQEVVREFCEHPPQFLGSQATPPQSTTSVSGYQSPSQYSFPGYQPMHSPQSVASGSSGLNMPTSQYLHHAPVTSPNMGTISPLSGLAKTSNTSTSISGPAKSSSSFPELEHLSLEELKDLSDQAEVMDIFLSKLDLVKTLEANKEELIMKNEEIARYNMSLQPKLECSKDELIKKFERRSELKLEFVNNSKKQKDMTESLSLLAIRRQMELAATEAEESSEVIADEFLSQKIPPEEFVPKFLEKRKLCHSRKAKEEKVRSIHTRY